MKKLLNKILIMMVIIIGLSQVAKTQINLLHTFESAIQCTGVLYSEQVFSPDCYVDGIVSDNSYILKVYNADFSVKSNITYNFTPQAGYKMSSVWVSKKIFNTDDNYEFFVFYYRTDPIYDDNYYKYILYNQNGNIIKDFGTARTPHSSYMYVVNNQFRFVLTKGLLNGGSIINYKTEVYSVLGTPPASPIITTITLPNGTVETEYNATITATGDAPMTWSLESGNLPNGLNISSNGIISGIPTTSETSNFTVKANNIAGSDTKDLTIIIDEKAGISTLQIADLKIYPNPTNGKLIIDCENYTFIKTIFYDTEGREVINQNISGQAEINISNLPKGIYNVCMISESGVIGNYKIVKQ